MERMLDFLVKASLVLTVFLVPLAFSPWTFGAFEFPKQVLLIVLVLVGFLAWAAKMVFLERKITFRRTPLDLPIVLFLLAAVLSSVFSVDRWASLFGFYGRFSDGLLGLLALGAFYFLVTNNLKKPILLVLTFLFSFGIAIASSYLALFGFFEQDFLPSFMRQAWFNPVSQSPKAFAVFLALAAVFLSSLILRPEVRQLPRAGNLLLSFSSLGLLLMLDIAEAWAVLLLGMLFLLAGTLAEGIAAEEEKGAAGKLLLPLALIFVSAAFLFSPAKLPGAPMQPVSEPVLSQGVSWGIAWETATESVKNAFVGSGQGTFAIAFSKERPAEFNESALWQTRFDRAGSHAAEILATRGFLGLLSYLFLAAWFLLASWLLFKKGKSLSFVAVVVAAFASQLFFAQTTSLALTFFLFLSLAALSWEDALKDFRLSLKKIPELETAGKILLLFLAGGIVAVLFLTAKIALADVSYLAAQRTPTSNLDLRIGHALEASRLNPWQAEYRIFLSRLHLERALAGLQKAEGERKEEQIAGDVRHAIAFARGDTVEEQGIAGATELSPKRVAAWEALGAVYRDITFAPGALDWAIRSFETASSLEPTNPVLHTELGKLYVTKEEFAKARERFEKALELKQDYAEAERRLALAAEKEGDSAKAVSMLENLLARSPLDMETMFQLGRLYYNTGRVPEAITQFQQILNIAPNHSNALFAFGVALEKQGNLEDAKRQFEKVLQLNPGNQNVIKKLQGLQE